ncbi:MAG: cache domain-containing protein [Candidatus Omnitrophica bacterium]|nr:cache domain-containing protein [Candidatus Omnitrophota bacterium]
MRIQNRVLLTFFGWLIPATLIGMLALYFFLVGSFQRYVGSAFFDSVSQTAREITSRITQEIEEANVLIQVPEVLSELDKANKLYENRDVNPRFSFKEKRELWAKSGPEDPFVSTYRLNPAAVRLREFQNYGWLRYNDIAITDREGALVAVTGKPHDFFRADEPWWQAAFDNGRGKIYIGGLQFDEDAKMLSFVLAMPIWDWRHERIIGVIKLALNTQGLFSSIYERSLGKTGATFLMDDNGNILLSNLAATISSDPEVTKTILSAKNGWAILPWGRWKKAIVGFSALDFSERIVEDYSVAGRWFIVTRQDLRETLSPVYILYGEMCGFAFFFVLLIGIIDFYIARKITSPIQALNKEAELVGEGNLDRKIEIRTGDEIEALSNSFNRMIERIRESHGELEQKVKERTEELNRRREELEKMNQFMLGREERMIELKKEIEYLKDQVRQLKSKPQ